MALRRWRRRWRSRTHRSPPTPARARGRRRRSWRGTSRRPSSWIPLAGLVNSGAKPVGLLTRFKNDYGFKLLSIPFDGFGDLYVPSMLTAQDYPGYIAPGETVATLGVPVVLAVYNWPPGTDRARRIKRFVDRFFDMFEGFQRPPYHPAWRSINLAAKVPGWVRYRIAADKLARMGASAPKPRQRAAAAWGRDVSR